MKNKFLTVNQFAVLLVISCSILGTFAQFSFKLASNHVISKEWINLFLNPYLLLGYIFYGISMLTLTIALKKGELSFLYPFISLTFVWVAIFSPIVFSSDNFQISKLLGVLLIVIGIFFIGFGGNNEN